MNNILLLLVFFLGVQACHGIRFNDAGNGGEAKNSGFGSALESPLGERGSGRPGADSEALALKLEESFFTKALQKQDVVDFSSLTAPEKFAIPGLELPCLENLTIENLTVVDVKPEFLSAKIDEKGQLLVIALDTAKDDGFRLRGDLVIENSCNPGNLAGAIAGGDPLGGLLDAGKGALGGVINGAMGTAGQQYGKPLKTPDIFGDIFGVNLLDPSLRDRNLFNANEFSALGTDFGLNDEKKQAFAQTLSQMPLDEFLATDLFSGSIQFQILFADTHLGIPLIPGTKQMQGHKILSLEVKSDAIEIAFVPKIEKFGPLPAELVQIIMDLIFPPELLAGMAEQAKEPAAEVISAELNKALKVQLQYLSGTLSRDEFSPLFEDAPKPIADISSEVDYSFDFHRAVIEQEALVLTLDGEIANDTAHPCIAGVPLFQMPSAENFAHDLMGFPKGEAAVAVSANLTSKLLYAAAKAGLFCLDLTLRSEDIVVIGEQLLSQALENVPKVGKLFPPEVRQATLRVFLDKLGILDKVKDKPIRITAAPLLAPRVDFDRDRLILRDFSILVRVVFGEEEVLRMAPLFSAEMQMELTDEGLRLTATSMQVGGNISIFPTYEDKARSLALDQAAAHLAGPSQYTDLLNKFLHGPMMEQINSGLPLHDLDLFGLNLAASAIALEGGYIKVAADVK